MREQVREEGLDLGDMRAVVLHVRLPDERPAGPLRAHPGILAAHEVDVARPQQAVVVVLRQPGQGVLAQRAPAKACAASACVAPVAAPGAVRISVGTPSAASAATSRSTGAPG